MLRKRPEKGGSVRMKKVLMPLPEDLHHQMRIRAAEFNITMREFIAQAIRDALEKGGKPGKK
jgi:hypothetical protein